jgi:excisionase family DNA binding protein
MVRYRGNGRVFSLAEIEARLRGNGFSEEQVDQVVTTLGPKPITIEEASEEFDIPQGTLYSWLRRRHLVPLGRIRFPARGGGKVLIDRNQVEELLRDPPRTGRPPKNQRQ